MASWTLFLDRDGVLNRRIPDGYVRSVDELEILDGVVDAVTALSAWTRRIVVVTNQAGVGKGLMSAAALDDIHRLLVQQVTSKGARIDAVLACPHTVGDHCGCRKPAPGLSWEAQRRFRDIDLARSVMVGDSVTDCGFAQAAGMRAVFIGASSELGAVAAWKVAQDLSCAVADLIELMTT